MKTLHLPVALWLAFPLFPVLASETQSPTLTLTLADLLRPASIPEVKPEPAPPPPVASALVSAVYTLDFSEAPPVLRLVATAENFSESWQLVPIHGGGLLFESAEPGGLVYHEGWPQWMSRERGERILDLKAALPLERDGVLNVSLAPAVSGYSRLIVSGTPQGQEVQVHGATPLQSDAGSKHWQLPTNGSPVRIQVAAPKPSVPSEWSLASAVLVTASESWLVYAVRMQLSARSGSGLEALLELPQHARGVEVMGEDLESWQLVREEGGAAQLRLQWSTRDLLDHEIRLSYKIAQAPLALRWELMAPRLASGDSEQDFVLVSPPGAQLRGEGLQEGAGRNRLPGWMADAVGASAFSLLAGPAKAAVEITWLPPVQTAAAVVTRGSHQTQIVEDGSMLTEATYVLALEHPTAWRIALPEGSRLLACTVDGKIAAPVAVDGALEFALPASGRREAKIVFSYTGNVGELDLVSGRLEVALPVTPLFAHELAWRLSLPESYEMDAVESNLTHVVPKEDEKSGGLVLQKRLTQGIPPLAEIFYKKRGLQ